MSVDILPLLTELTVAGQAYAQSIRGKTSEARVHETLAGKAGQAVTSEAELKTLFRNDGAFSTLATRRFIRLPDTRDGPNVICPIVFLDGDLSTQHPYLRVQLVIVTHSPHDNTAPQCLLIRFETPENGNPAGTGMHDYYHSQLCQELRVDRSTKTFPIPSSIAWGALSCPAWPIDASTPLELLTCVIFALYGKADGLRILRSAYGNRLDELIADMHFVIPGKAIATAPQKKPSASRKRRRAR